MPTKITTTVPTTTEKPIIAAVESAVSLILSRGEKDPEPEAVIPLTVKVYTGESVAPGRSQGKIVVILVIVVMGRAQVCWMASIFTRVWEASEDCISWNFVPETDMIIIIFRESVERTNGLTTGGREVWSGKVISISDRWSMSSTTSSLYRIVVCK